MIKFIDCGKSVSITMTNHLSIEINQIMCDNGLNISWYRMIHGFNSSVYFFEFHLITSNGWVLSSLEFYHFILLCLMRKSLQRPFRLQRNVWTNPDWRDLYEILWENLKVTIQRQASFDCVCQYVFESTNCLDATMEKLTSKFHS